MCQSIPYQHCYVIQSLRKITEFQKPRSTKAESQVDELRPPLSKGSAAAVHKEEPGEDGDYFDKDTDPEMQEVYVQAYSCQVFRDDAAAQAVEDGAHLRPLAMPQVRSFGCCDRGPVLKGVAAVLVQPFF